MSNPKITIENYTGTNFTTIPIQEETTVPQKRNYTPIFITYDNQQTTIIFDILDLIHHVGCVIDQMIESGFIKEPLGSFYAKEIPLFKLNQRKLIQNNV